MFSMWAVIAVAWTGDAKWLPLILLILAPSLRKILGPSFEDWHKTDREVSGRALFVGFLIFFVIFWVGGITVAHYISPEHQPPKFVVWPIAGVLWLASVVPACLWWRTQKGTLNA